MRRRLKRNISRRGEIGCLLLFALVLGAAGAWIAIAIHPQGHHGGKALLVIVNVVCGGFILGALVHVYLAIHRTFALASPETIVEVEPEILVRGHDAHVHFTQDGHLELESLHAKLVGTDTTGENPRTIASFDFLETGQTAAPLLRDAILHIPMEAQPSSSGTMWHIEVRGRIRGRVNFEHLFPVQIV
jgi:hypothetical protein